MTTIVGIQHEDGCILASDSRVVAEGKIYTHPDMVKSVAKGGYIYGVSGDYRVLQILLHIWKPPLVTEKARDNVYEFAITKIVPSIKQSLSDAGIDVSKMIEDKFEFSVLMGINGTLLEIDSYFSVTMNDSNYYAIGSGGDFALGALYAGAGALDALRIAAINNNGTSAPFHILEQKTK